MRLYSATELDQILRRHRNKDRGMYAIGLGLAALSGAFVMALIWWRLA